MKQTRCSRIRSCALHGIQGILVDIEAAILPGLPSFDIVGLGDSAVRESRNRVHAAIKNSGFEFPASRITASYAPAWLRKEGSAFDLPLALAILAASGQIPAIAPELCVMGELSLNGEVRRIPGVICRAASCRENGVNQLMVPTGNAVEASVTGDQGVWPVGSLRAATEALNGQRQPRIGCAPAADKSSTLSWPELPERDISSIIGQEKAIRALQIAAAGRHNLLLLGSPGCGKTTLATLLASLLPPLDTEEALQVTRIYSASGLINDHEGLMIRRPFRSPHHSITRSAMIGGGALPQPGEISLAHQGVLFLDEMTEFQPDTLDLLRQPMEERVVRLARMRQCTIFPADFLLIGAANPCRCGEGLEPGGSCRCSDESRRQHLNRLSGPLLDRIDLAVEMTRLSPADLPRSVSQPEQSLRLSESIAESVRLSWQSQKERNTRKGQANAANGRVSDENLLDRLEISRAVAEYAAQAAKGLRLSVRGYQRILRVSRTIADLAGEADVRQDHVAEAFQYRLRLP